MEKDNEIITEKKGFDKPKSHEFKKSRGNRQFRRGHSRGMPTHGGNDFAFWNKYPELMSIATRFPWMHIAGTPLVGSGVKLDLPNVAVQHYLSVPGVAANATDPLNLAFRKLFLDMHRKYRGIGTYQASDIGIVMLCIESVLQLLVEAERVYGILKGYPLKSRIEPEGLLLAMGYPGTFIWSVKNELADFRYNINRLIDRAKRLPLPSGMNFFKNHVAMNGFVYKDSEDERASLIVFVFDNYYKWQTTGDPGCINSSSTALSVPFDRSTITGPAILFNLIESTMNLLLTDSDVLRITSDFISCYGENNMQVLAPLPEDYKVEATYSESILHKWHNSERYKYDPNSGADVAFSYVAQGSSTTTLPGGQFAVYQYNDVIQSRPTFCEQGVGEAWNTAAGGQMKLYGSSGTVISIEDTMKGYVNDSWKSDPSEDLICESLLWKIDATNVPDSTASFNTLVLRSAGTEILTDLEIVAVSNSAISYSNRYQSSFTRYSTYSISSGLCHFDWAPYIFDTDGNTGEIISIQGDTDNVTVVSREVILKVLDAAMLSAFAVEMSGSGSEN